MDRVHEPYGGEAVILVRRNRENVCGTCKYAIPNARERGNGPLCDADTLRVERRDVVPGRYVGLEAEGRPAA